MRQHDNQRGAILVTSLLLLLILTILGLAVMRMTRMQERMAGNSRDVSLAFQAAEAALREGEMRVLATAKALQKRPDTAGLPCLLPVVCGRGVLPVGMADQVPAWWAVNGTAYRVNGTTKLWGLAVDPLYVIEEVGQKPQHDVIGHGDEDYLSVYQVTARSTGGSGQTNTVLQSTVAYPF